MRDFFAKLGSACLEAAFPDCCQGCGGGKQQSGPFCGACLERAGCTGAGGPLPETGEGGLKSVAALAWYREPLGGVLRDFKYRRHYAKGKKLGLLVESLAGPEPAQGADVMAPVPLHRLRLIRRGFNQACVLFRPMARAGGLCFEPRLLLRTRRTRPQTRLDKMARLENVAGAFAVNPKRAGLIKGKNVLLVDDVFTTGATLNECARVLLSAGAGKVSALVLARPARESQSG